MSLRLLLLLYCLVGLNLLPLSQAEVLSNTDEHIVWQRAPIQITLPVGQERFVTFSEEVQFGYNLELLPASKLRVQNDHHTLYLTAKRSFAPQRVEAKLADGQIILLDISAKMGGDTYPIDIVLPQNQVTINHNSRLGQASLDYATLMRFAIQQLYAPSRLLTQPFNITRFPMNTDHVVPIWQDGSVIAMPLASWRGNHLYVTAIVIKNRLHQSLILNPHTLCGEWQAVSFYPRRHLKPQASSFNQDGSTLFVISSVPFSQAMQSCLS